MEHDDVTLTGLVTMQPSTHLSVLCGVIKCRCHGDRPLTMKHDVAISPMDTVRLPPNFAFISPVQPSTAPRQLWGFIICRFHGNASSREDIYGICRCHGNTMLHETRFSQNFSENAPNGPKLHRFGNDAAINASNHIMGCHQMPLPWRQTTRHETRCRCKSNGHGPIVPQSSLVYHRSMPQQI